MHASSNQLFALALWFGAKIKGYWHVIQLRVFIGSELKSRRFQDATILSYLLNNPLLGTMLAPGISNRDIFNRNLYTKYISKLVNESLQFSWIPRVIIFKAASFDTPSSAGLLFRQKSLDLWPIFITCDVCLCAIYIVIVSLYYDTATSSLHLPTITLAPVFWLDLWWWANYRTEGNCTGRGL